MSDMTFDSAYEFRVYTLNDVLQVKIRDSQEIFATLRLAELPLCEGHDEEGVCNYVQVGQKQMLVRMRLMLDHT